MVLSRLTQNILRAALSQGTDSSTCVLFLLEEQADPASPASVSSAEAALLLDLEAAGEEVMMPPPLLIDVSSSEEMLAAAPACVENAPNFDWLDERGAVMVEAHQGC